MSIDPISGGGTAERTIQLTNALNNEGANAAILTTEKGFNSNIKNKYADLDIYKAKILIDRYYVPTLSFYVIKRIISTFDVINLTNHWNILNAMVMYAAYNMNIPYIVTPAGSLKIFGRSKIKKSIYTALAGGKIISKADGWVAISSNEIPLFCQYGILEENISLIPNGINPKEYLVRNESYQTSFESKKYILFVGRLNKIKGPDILLHAYLNIMTSISDYDLVFAGPDDGMMDYLNNIVQKHGASSRVHFVGYVGGEEKNNLYRNADLVVIPSRQEAMSIVVLESGMAKKGVLMTDKCGFDVVDKIDGGMIVSANVENLQSGIVEILSSPEKLIVMGSNLYRFVKNEYTWAKSAGKYLALCNKVIEQRS